MSPRRVTRTPRPGWSVCPICQTHYLAVHSTACCRTKIASRKPKPPLISPDDPAWLQDREARIEAYRRQAALKLPLFSAGSANRPGEEVGRE